MEVKTQLAENPLSSPRLSRDEKKLEPEAWGPVQQNPPRDQGQKASFNISRVHLYSSQGQQEKGIQTDNRQVARRALHGLPLDHGWTALPLCLQGQSPKVMPKPEKKPEPKAQKNGDAKTHKKPVNPGIMDFGLIQEALKAPHAQKTPGTYRFGRLSHHSFFSRHHPHPQHVTHIQDLTGKPVCMVRNESSVSSLLPPILLSSRLMGMPISDPNGPQSNRNPHLSSENWVKKLKELTSRVAFFTKEDELVTEEKEEPPREQGAKYSSETGRLIPASSQALTRRSSRQSQRNHPSSRDGGIQASLLQNQELLVLELLCQILQTDSLRAIQFWLLFAPPKEKELALGLLQTAVAKLLPHPLTSIPAEKLLSQIQELQQPFQEKQVSSSSSLKKMKTPPLPKCEKPEYMGNAQVLRVHSNEDTEEKAPKSKTEG